MSSYVLKSNLTFKCEASGTPAPYVYWDYEWKLYKNCIFIESGFNISYLKIINCQYLFIKIFSCHATNIAGTDQQMIILSDSNASCGNNRTFNNLSGKIRFQWIGNVYSNNVECRWLIDVDPYLLRVEINDVDFWSYDICFKNYVAFYDNPTYQNEISRYCSNKNVVFFHKSGILYIKVVADSFASSFTLTWSSERAAYSKFFVSPKIKYETYFDGTQYIDKSNATFKCEASGTPAPYIYWDYKWRFFENCTFSQNGFNLSYLKIINCQIAFITQFVCCAISIAGTDEKTMVIESSDFNLNCGNKSSFNNPFGKIRFPSIGNEYLNNVECRWLIDVAPYILRVEINLDLETGDKCDFDYVAFYDNPTYQNEISRFCSNKNVVYFHKSGILYIKVVTDHSIYASGFTLTWNSEHAKNSQVLGYSNDVFMQHRLN